MRYTESQRRETAEDFRFLLTMLDGKNVPKALEWFARLKPELAKRGLELRKIDDWKAVRHSARHTA